MTPEEAREIIKQFRDRQGNSIDDVEALDMAIKALKQEPCEDAVSRADALKAIEEQKKGFYGVERYAIDECHSAVLKLPSVTPKCDLEPYGGN